MRFEVGEHIYVREATHEFLNWCRNNLILDNPEYYKKERMGRWCGNTPKYIYLYERNGGDVIIPFGCVADLMHRFPAYTFMSRIRPRDSFNYNSTINLYSYQEKAVTEALNARNGVIVMPCGSGKGLPVDAKICTPTGWKRNGNLQIGDMVVGSNGKATRVTGIFDRGKVDAYKITFSDGVTTVCDKDHLWTVQKQSQRAESGNWFVENTENIYKHYQNMKCRSQKLYIPIVEPVDFYGYENYRNIDPWLLGFLLGDGCFQKSMITMSTSEDDLLQKVIDIIGKDYEALEWLTHKQKYDWRFCGGYVLHNIETLGLKCKHSYEKFIPKEYLFAPVNVRLKVLQGLFDADGHISNGMTYEYSTSSKQLADDFVFIVESLGGTAKVKEIIPTYAYNGEKRVGKKSYRIFFKLYKFKPFTSAKHSAAYQERTHYNKAYRIIKTIEPCEPIISRCIMVDASDQLYVAEHFVVTHNTQCALELISRIGLKALWLTHTQDLLNQSMNRAKSVFGCSGYGTITGGKVNIGSGLTFATVQTMSKLDLRKYRDTWGCVVVDECFPADTLIATKNGQKKINDLLRGDLVASYNRDNEQIEFKPVVSTFKLIPRDLLKVTMNDGTVINATGNHPFFVKNSGWVCAREMERGDYVMQLVRQGVRRNKETVDNKSKNKKTRLRLLLSGLCISRNTSETRMDGRAQSKVCGAYEKNQCRISRSNHRTNDKKKSNEKPRNKSKGVSAIERDRTQTKFTWRERHRDNKTARNACERNFKKPDRFNDFCGISNSNKSGEGFWISNLLQGRYSFGGADDSNRNRRRLALFIKKTGARQKERTIIKWIRVDSIEIQKSTSDGTFGGLCSDGYVYNIEVADNNNYFANGILVHNCHKAIGSPTKVMQFYKVLSNLSCRYKFGLTATPKRADGLEASMFALIGGIICEIGRDAVEDTTCPVEVRTVETGYMPDLDMALAGDGTVNYAGLVDDMVHNENRFEVVMDFLASIKIGQPVLVLANRVEYLQRLCTTYKERQIGEAICLSAMGNSKSSKQARKQALKALNDGELDCLFATYQLAAEGLDCPNLRYVVFATPEKNERVVEQASGRVARKAEGKDVGIVIDFVDSFGMFRGWAKKRENIYRKLGYAVNDIY